jgi:UDP-N-acetylglucosamine 2-epimerase|tara:strand:- start:145 stop:1200 length:1056 start_codon:yes stop_codon:yes gene_type:complete
MLILTVIGARPQFIKSSMVSRALRKKGVKEILVHTGQHYDENMSKVFFDEMGIHRPNYNLGVGSGAHGEQTAKSLEGIEKVLIHEKPDLVLVYGDTNATLAGALAASKLHLPIAHVEAGLRSYNRSMPEEINRILTDTISKYLFCPTTVSVENLNKEGIINGVHLTGDVMVDSLFHFTAIAETKSDILEKLNLNSNKYGLMTIHRPSNADDRKKLSKLLNVLNQSPIPLIFPIHPRTRKLLSEFDFKSHKTIQPTNPLGYLDMLLLEKNAQVILTDSGGIQKEAYLQKVPCLTLRPETEWVETVEDGWNTLVNEKYDELPDLIKSPPVPKQWISHYGKGNAAGKITSILLS